MKKRNVFIISIIFFILTSTVSWAIMPHYTYKSVNVIVSRIMMCIGTLGTVGYIVYSIIYLIKTKEDRKNKAKKLIIGLIIVIIIGISLALGAEKVLEAGKTYTTAPYIDDLPIIK